MVLNIVSNFPNARLIFLHVYCPLMAITTDLDNFWGFLWICVFGILCFLFYSLQVIFNLIKPILK